MARQGAGSARCAASAASILDPCCEDLNPILATQRIGFDQDGDAMDRLAPISVPGRVLEDCPKFLGDQLVERESANANIGFREA